MIKIEKALFISHAATQLNPSITHGTRARIAKMNQNLGEKDQVIDLSIGTLDEPTSQQIDSGVIQFIKEKPEIIHAFAPVKGFPFLRQAIAERMERLHHVNYCAENEIMVTPGGIKGTLTIAFHTLLNPGDEVLIPIPNWPHYADMLKLHHAKPKFIKPDNFPKTGLTSKSLESAITDKTKLLILGDCINPTGKVYTDEELQSIADVISRHNESRLESGISPIFVLLDCPYEAHIFGKRPRHFSTLKTPSTDGSVLNMRDYTLAITGPGKTYGMHGDRIGYMCAPSEIISYAENVQVNLNSFASTYGQIATYFALQKAMDTVPTQRALSARKNLDYIYKELNDVPGVAINYPSGSYFIFINFTKLSHLMSKKGFQSAGEWLLQEAKVATICGQHFANGYPGETQLNYFVRMNCGRDEKVIQQAIQRIKQAIKNLSI